MILRRDVSLFKRLLASYLAIVLVCTLTLLGMSEVVAPFFLERHVSSMGLTSATESTDVALMRMLDDLRGSYRRAFSQSLLSGVVASLLLAGVLSLFVSRQIVLPLQGMHRASRRIADGRYKSRLDVTAPGEIGDLASSFNAMAAALDEVESKRTELLGNVAHEFGTPLSSVRGNLEGLQDGLFTLEDETIEVSLQQVARLERLVADLSLLSRVEAGQERVVPEHVDVNELTTSAASALERQFNSKGVALKVVTPTPSLTALADPLRTGQVLGNLLANALRHTPAGGKVTLRTEAKDAYNLLVSVEDTGRGIPSGVIPHIFTRFYRGDEARRANQGSGSGVGLTVAKHFVEAQGGEIGVESQMGQGSTFWFTLPLAGSFTKPLQEVCSDDIRHR